MALFKLLRPRHFHYEPRFDAPPAERQNASDEYSIRLRSLLRRPLASSQNQTRWLLLFFIITGLWYCALQYSRFAPAVRWDKVRAEEVLP